MNTNFLSLSNNLEFNLIFNLILTCSVFTSIRDKIKNDIRITKIAVDDIRRTVTTSNNKISRDIGELINDIAQVPFGINNMFIFIN